MYLFRSRCRTPAHLDKRTGSHCVTRTSGTFVRILFHPPPPHIQTNGRVTLFHTFTCTHQSIDLYFQL